MYVYAYRESQGQNLFRHLFECRALYTYLEGKHTEPFFKQNKRALANLHIIYRTEQITLNPREILEYEYILMTTTRTR